MKKVNLFLLMAMLFAASIIVSSCGDDDDGDDDDTTTETGGLDGTRLWGEISSDITLSQDTEYTLDGGVHIQSGATITIEAGVTVKAVTSKVSYLLIEKGGMINAVGTATNPIVFTSDKATPAPGDWGGIMICGKATINAVGGTGTSEVGNAEYGGNDDTDNSGTVSYVRLEYTGIAFDEEHESNGFAFYALGSGTTLNHLQAYKGADDGFEFFGGTVTANYLVSTHSEDDSFDWTQGWRGKGQYWLAVQANGVGDRGIEADNNSGDNTLTPFSNPTLCNVTLLGGGKADKYGMKLREGTKGKFHNILVTGFTKRTIHVEHNQTLTNVNNDALIVEYAKIDTNVTDKPVKYSVSKIQSTNDEDGDGDVDEDDLINDPNGPSVNDPKKFENNANNDLTTVTATSSTTFQGGVDAATIDASFESNTNIGSGDTWTQGWTRNN